MSKNCSCQGSCCGKQNQDPFQIDSIFTVEDFTDHLKARLGIERFDLKVTPGLYKLGSPDNSSPVLVTGNYKLSFNEVRTNLEGHSAWLLVLDTRGINVWCAAGKGTFGTYELCKRIKETKLHEKVTHRRLILPQLGAPGIKAHAVTKDTEFEVCYGPVYAKDLPAFIATGTKTKEMKRIHFSLWERMVLIPIEIQGGLKTFLSGLIIIPFIYFALLHSFQGMWVYPLLWLGTFLCGTVLFPIMLPLFPWKSFSLSGIILGSLWINIISIVTFLSWKETLSFSFMAAGLCGYLTFNFTGATTFTCPSGVEKEMKKAIPALITLSCIGLLLGLIFLVRGIWF